MFTITKQVPVEVIHAEFDSAEERVLNSCNELLSSLKITTEDKLESKASKLEALGFVNSEPVKQFKEFKTARAKVEEKITLTENIVKTIQDLKFEHPYDMFITIDELERICNKYDLIHAPVANYIKDIPEQNVLDMVNRKPISSNFTPEIEIKLIGLRGKSLLQLFGKTEPIFTLDDINRINYYYSSVKMWFLEGSTTWAFVAVRDGLKDVPNSGNYRYGDDYQFNKIEKINKTGLFIAAPKSHFDLKDLSKKSKFGFFNVTVHEVKDPVVFEYCLNNIVRIVTKWGTDDDKSYLDEGLINETLN